MSAAGVARFDGFGDKAARKLEIGHVGHWITSPDRDSADARDFAGARRTVAVEIDPGDGSSLVVFVQAPNRRDVPGDFHPDDVVSLVLPETVTDLYDVSDLQ